MTHRCALFEPFWRRSRCRKARASRRRTPALASRRISSARRCAAAPRRGRQGREARRDPLIGCYREHASRETAGAGAVAHRRHRDRFGGVRARQHDGRGVSRRAARARKNRRPSEAIRCGLGVQLGDLLVVHGLPRLRAVRSRRCAELRTGTASTIDVSLSDWQPKRIEATDPAIEVFGSGAEHRARARRMDEESPGRVSRSVSAHGISVTAKPSATETPWLTLTGGSLSASTAGVSFAADHAAFSGVDIGNVLRRPDEALRRRRLARLRLEKIRKPRRCE